VIPYRIEWLAAALLVAGAADADSDPARDCVAEGHDVIAEVRARGTLRVAHTNDYRPFSSRAADGSPVGIDVDLARSLAAELGVAIDWVDTTWSTLAADLRASRYDIAMSGVSETPDRAASGCFTTAYFITGKTALTRCAMHRTFDTIAQLDAPDISVIVNRGGTNERFVREHIANARIIVHDDNRTVFEALASGSGDVMITDAVEARLQAQANPALCLADPAPLFETVEKAYLLPKDPAWQARVDAWLNRLRANGELTRIIARHLAPRS
jgi:ABC-type amino acid transport substrate-binding protein